MLNISIQFQFNIFWINVINLYREEIEASNHRNSKKDDVIKNQVEDKGECNKLLTEG